MTVGYSESIESYCAHIKNVVLPFWHDNTFSKETSLFAERLDLTGNVLLNTPHRAMVQARQIFVYSHAASTGVFPQGAEYAMRAVENLLECFCDAGGVENGLHFSITKNGDVVSSVRDSYTHAFVLFSFAAAYRLSGDRNLRLAIDHVVSFVDQRLSDPRSFGLFDQFPPSTSLKAQNPLMHLLEAYLALHEAIPDGDFLVRAAAIVEHFKSRMFMHKHGVLVEKYGDDWSVLDEQSPDLFYEPGHQFEWAWLLHRFGSLAKTDESLISDRLWQTARRHGLNAKFLCYDEVSLTMEARRRSHRLWPHAEGAKIAAVRTEAGDGDARPVAEAMAYALNNTFLHQPFEGGWIDRVDEAHCALIDFVPASSLYHLYTAFVELAPLTKAGYSAERQMSGAT